MFVGWLKYVANDLAWVPLPLYLDVRLVTDKKTFVNVVK